MINLNQSEVKFQKVVRTAQSCSVKFELDDKVYQAKVQVNYLENVNVSRSANPHFAMVNKCETTDTLRCVANDLSKPRPINLHCGLQRGCGNFLFRLVAPAGFLHSHYRHDLTFIRALPMERS